jgi:mannose-6-phosphate isomerase
MTNLYPIKFDPIVKERVWGGDALVKIYGKEYDGNKAIGESWEIR